MDLNSEELSNLKNSFMKLYIKSVTMVPNKHQRNQMLDKLTSELFSRKIEELEQCDSNITYDEKQNLLIQFKELIAEWIIEFDEGKKEAAKSRG
ncbi:MAG TPA: hypothetical protein VHT96_10205 [Clostridia bacterium]|nr:hypothetical protein [Clostridia bacterium]